VAQEIERGGCAVPAAIEWRDPVGTAPLPPMLANLLGLQGVALGVGALVRPEDRAQLLLWQRRGLVLLPLDRWCERYLRSLPAALLPPDWPGRWERFGRLREGQNARLKRLQDLLLAGLALLLLAIPLGVALVVLRLQGRRCQLRQEGRRGLEGQPFQLLSLVVDPQAPAWWRRSGLAGAPALIGVLRGEMGLVGPRPLPLLPADRPPTEDDDLEMRFWVKPGLIRWSPGRSLPRHRSHDPADELPEDLCYLANWSLWLDLACLGRWLLGQR
jgi:lipopolysaccharide/colanic/teichoic acid biosynthesis glycosyltransferase